VSAAADIFGVQEGAHFGLTVGAADVNGDGFTDILVGAPYHDEGQNNEGRGFVFYGNNSRGLARIPDQARTDFTAPVALLGISDAETGFGLTAEGRTAAGRGRVWMEWEAKPLGTLLDGTGIWTGTPHDTGVPTSTGSAVAITETVIGFPPETLAHWHLRLASHNPFFPRTPWFSHSGNGPQELDVRTAPGTQDIADGSSWTAGLRLNARPNPFRLSTQIAFAQQTASKIRLTVHDPQGRLVRSLFDGRVAAGKRHFTWDGTDEDGRRTAQGIYYLRLATEETEISRPIIRLE
jgi:hypothetical protein